ncbi:hypothetical protein KCU93_g490, partial [Aureobasidium melanogenum]
MNSKENGAACESLLSMVTRNIRQCPVVASVEKVPMSCKDHIVLLAKGNSVFVIVKHLKTEGTLVERLARTAQSLASSALSSPQAIFEHFVDNTSDLTGSSQHQPSSINTLPTTRASSQRAMSTWTRLSNVGRMVVLVDSREGKILVRGGESQVLVAEAGVGAAEAVDALAVVLYYRCMLYRTLLQNEMSPQRPRTSSVKRAIGNSKQEEKKM